MHYQFPVIRSITDVLPAIQDRKEFIHVEKEWYDVINYAVSTPETFQDPFELGISDRERNFRLIRRECRGIKFDKQGTILARPYHKFFNLGERDETQMHKVDLSKSHVMLDKLDGSMIHPIFNREHNGFRFGTKMGITDVAFMAEVYVGGHPKYWRFVRDMYEQGLTPIFEWTSPANRIVVNYKDETLAITAVRGTVSGNYLDYATLEELSASYNIPLVKYIVNRLGLSDFVEKTKEMSGIEGFIVRFNDGHMLKIKIPEYVLMHKSKDLVSSNRRTIELILNEEIDDIKPQLSQDDIDRVEDLEGFVGAAIQDKSLYLKRHYEFYKDWDRKEFALMAAKSSTMMKWERSAIFRMMDGAHSYSVARDFFKARVGKEADYEELVNRYGFPK